MPILSGRKFETLPRRTRRRNGNSADSRIGVGRPPFNGVRIKEGGHYPMTDDDGAEISKRKDETPRDKTAEEEARARRAAADSLRRQIENLKVGIKPRSLNEFIEEKMAEDRDKSKEAAAEKQQ
jgi:hypothetical protein